MRAARVTAIVPLVIASLALIGLLGYRDLTALQNVAQGSAPRLTYTKDVAPILFEHCAGCHNPSGSAPFSVLDFESVRPHGRAIAASTESRAMPPWLPEPGYGDFAGNRRLTTD